MDGMMGNSAYNNGSWIRTPGDDVGVRNLFIEEQKALRLRQYALESRAARQKRIIQAPARAMKQYRNAIRKIGLMAVSEALGV
jgi:hypothetical protein